MEIAYRYGATFLAEPYPAGAGEPKAAIEVLRKGVENNPHSWRLRQDLGLFHYFFLGDAQEASRILLEAARLPGRALLPGDAGRQRPRAPRRPRHRPRACGSGSTTKRSRAR